MKRFLIISLVALSLAGCITLDPVGKSILQGGNSITAPVLVPQAVTKSPYQARLSLNIGVKAANRWSKYCWALPYEKIVADPLAGPICQDRRPVRRALVDAADKADKAIKKASDFIRANPTVSAVSLVNDAWAAVDDYRSKIPMLPSN